MSLEEGQEFADFEEFALALKTYENEWALNFTVADSTSLQRARRKQPNKSFSDKLKYAYIKYGCQHHGRYRAQGKNIRKNIMTMKCECPAVIVVGSNLTGDKLKVRKMTSEHNHPIIRDAFSHTTRQRKLPVHVSKEAALILELGANPTKLKEHLTLKTGLNVTSGDVQNIMTASMENKRILDEVEQYERFPMIPVQIVEELPTCLSGLETAPLLSVDQCLSPYESFEDGQVYIIKTEQFSVDKASPGEELSAIKVKTENGESKNRKTLSKGKKLYKCELCPKQFSKNSLFKRHWNTHTGEKPFRCEVCLQQFSQISILNSHLRIHTGEKPYKCRFCDKLFSQSGNLKRHISIHTGEKPYKCEFCMKQFSVNNELQRHMRIHTGEKPFRCELCMKQFSLRSILNCHMRIHTGEKPYKCDICFQQFSQNNLLQRHRNTHTGEKPYKCELCMQSYSRKDHLGKHMRCHAHTDQYKSGLSFKQFSHKNSLSLHSRIDTSEQPYKCEVCMKSFYLKASFAVHKRSHTGENPS